MFPLILIQLFLILAICIQGASAKEESVRVYIASSEQGIYTSELRLNDGSLSQPVLRHPMKGAGFLTWHPKYNRLYSTASLHHKQSGVIAFQANENGSLSELKQLSTRGYKLCHISTDHTGHMLMGASYGGGSVISIQLGQEGQLGLLTSVHQHQGAGSHPKRQTRAHAHSIYPGPANQFAYAADLGANEIVCYQMTPKAGTLKRMNSTPLHPAAGPRHMKFHPTVPTLYVLNELDTTVSVFKRVRSHSTPSNKTAPRTSSAFTGKLLHLQTLSMYPKERENSEMTSSEVQVSQDCQYLYCATRDLTDQQRDAVTVFQIQENGLLKRIQVIHPGVWFPRHIQLAPCGAYLLVAGQRANGVSVMKINRHNGTLQPAHQTIPIPSPMCISFRP